MKIAMELCLVAWLTAGPAAGQVVEGVPSYTNADLERVSGEPDRTGAASRVEAPPPAGPPPERRLDAADETRWRRDAQRLRERLEPLEDEIAELRARIEKRRAEPGVRVIGDPKLESWQQRLRRLEERRRERWLRFLRRARRARVPPGWLR